MVLWARLAGRLRGSEAMWRGLAARRWLCPLASVQVRWSVVEDRTRERQLGGGYLSAARGDGCPALASRSRCPHEMRWAGQGTQRGQRKGRRQAESILALKPGTQGAFRRGAPNLSC